MTNDVMAKNYMALYERHIIRYVFGGWLQPLNDKNKAIFLNNYAENRNNATIKEGIRTATANNLAGDCVCTIKSFLDNLVGVDNQTSTMRKPCPDISIQDMLKTECVDVSTDLNNILIFEFMAYADYSHCGIYMGKINGQRMVAEVTQRWDNGLQLISMDREERKGMWKYHGKLWNFMNYNYKGDTLFGDINPAPVDTKKQLQTCVKEMQTLCNKMNNLIAKL